MVVLAAVDVQALAGDGPGHGRGQEHHRVGDLVGFRQPAQVGGGGRLVVDLLAVHPALLGQVSEVLLQRAGPDVAGRHRVDPDLVGAKFGGQALRQRQQRGLGHLVPAEGSRECRSTAELIITTEPWLAASAGVNRLVSRSTARTLVSRAVRSASGSASARLVSGGIANALCTSVSARPNSASVACARCAAAASSVMSAGTASARRPSAVTSLATSSRRPAVRAASTTSAPSRAQASAIDRPRPGPTPETTATVPASSAISPASWRRRRPGGRRSAPRTPPVSPEPAGGRGE